MPKMNGLELAEKINERNEGTKIIFTTAYKQYALDAFQVYAFDYILKPVTPEAIDRIASRLLKQVRPAAIIEPQEKEASLRCFGGFEVFSRSGSPVRWPTRKTEELFAFFLCHSGKELSKWHLADLLWPQMEEERALHNLHNTIYRLKKMLKENEVRMDVRKINEGYMLNTAGLMYDVMAFERYASFEDTGKELAQLEQLCSMYKGPLLDRKDYSWKVALEEWYGKQYTLLVRKLIDMDLSEQQWSRAEQRLDVYLSIHPLHEEMNQLIMDIYESRGQRDKMITHYKRFEASYLQDLGLEPPEWMKKRLISSRMATEIG
ncbi:response regulator [Paenibacillus sp. RC67]|uniref:response regulator n=1 Tax=Paenibacillus sp. RC67 TaxID=3039392 RepID=UPI0024AE390F|nr:response regulator [Paenibacillus sp. RC67]